MWRQGARASWRAIRRLSVAARGRQEDAGDWAFSPEWWEPQSGGSTVFREVSDHGNGVVSVVAHQSSRPSSDQWPEVEKRLQQRYSKLHPESDPNAEFRVLGYQWRVLHFNDNTRQSAAKVMSAYRQSKPGSLYLMQEPHCLAVPYLKSMLSAGLSTLTSLGFDLPGAILGSKTMRILCIGHGGGSLPLFLASKLQGAIIDVVEIDPIVVAASIQAMGFPACKVNKLSAGSFNLVDMPNQDIWPVSIPRRLSLHIADASDFLAFGGIHIPYDLAIIDAYDGDDIFPQKLWDPDGDFLRSLAARLHPAHGVAVVNLHADADIAMGGIATDWLDGEMLPMGKYVSQVCRAYKRHVGTAFKVSVPWLCNISLVACRHRPAAETQSLMSGLITAGNRVEDLLDLPFPCVEYLKRGFSEIN
ncbi:S-adenosyl-L-methionine-dependent methyltransferases superfamily protein [Wolffia australiana]